MQKAPQDALIGRSRGAAADRGTGRALNSSAGAGRREYQVGLPPPNYAQEWPGRAGRALDEMAFGRTRRPVRRGVIRAAVAAPAAAAGPPAAVAGVSAAGPRGAPRPPTPSFRRGPAGPRAGQRFTAPP